MTKGGGAQLLEQTRYSILWWCLVVRLSLNRRGIPLEKKVHPKTIVSCCIYLPILEEGASPHITADGPLKITYLLDEVYLCPTRILLQKPENRTYGLRP